MRSAWFTTYIALIGFILEGPDCRSEARENRNLLWSFFFFFFVLPSARHVGTLSASGDSMSDASTKPCCSSADGCIVSRVRPCWVHVLSLKGVLSLIHMFTHTHTHSLMVTMMHPFSHPRTHHKPTVMTSSPSHLLYFLLPSVCCSPSGSEGASPVKLHLWHSDHSTYFNSFQVTSLPLVKQTTKVMFTSAE